MPVTDLVTLRFATGRTRVRLRELTGADEHAVSGTATEEALRLLDALILTLPGESTPARAEDLVASDRDRLLVAVYRRAFGDRIDNTLTCAQCRNRFDIDFSLGALATSLDQTAVESTARRIDDNRFETADGLRFKLPTGRDELMLAALAPAEAEAGLLRCCAANEEGSMAAGDPHALTALLAEVAPLVDLELDARCPECRHSHAVQFDIQTYLLGALLGERPRLAQEIHRIAIAYGWGRDEILGLSRSERRQFIELIDNEAAARARRYWG
jgi:hypothetical protein